VDLSFLNARKNPPGKRGFVKAVGDQLMFADNTPVRFWGTNLSAYSLFKSPDEEIKPTGQAPVGPGFQPGAPASPRLALGQPQRLRR
jgi:hypothetical protein